MDLLLNSAGDLDLSTNDLQLVDGIDAIRQHLQIRYRFFLGEWFLNTDEGVPYVRDVLRKNPNEARVRAILAEVARSTPGVNRVASLTLDLDSALRILTVSIEVEVDLSGELTYTTFVIEVDL